MVIKDIDRSDFRLLVEEQFINGRIYKISDSYCPAMDSISKRVSISIINEDSDKKYEELHGLELSDGKVKSFYIFNDKNGSSHESGYLDDQGEYYDEIINGFDAIINSNTSEFTNKALTILESLKDYMKKRGPKNGI